MPTYDVDVEGVTYEVDAPNPDTAWQWANYTHRQKKAAAPKPATGLLAAAGKGLESLIGAGTTAAGATFGSPEEAARAGLERQKKLEEKYADQVSLEKVKKAYEKRGVLSAAGEALSQVPYALAEQLPNLATAIGGAKLGAMAGTAVAPGAGSALGAIIGGGLGAFAPSFVQQYGGNIERQAAEQEKAGKPLDISRTAAAAAAGPQAALDVAATFIPLGRTVAGKVLGPEVKALLERGQKEAAEKLAKESLGKTLAKGTLIGGAAEIPTEVTQQVLERAQAGLSLTDDDALKEYGETAYQVGLLAPLGAAGRVTDRSAAKSRVAAEAATAEAAQRKAAREAEEAKKKDPAYALKLDADYQAAVARMKELQAAVPKRPGKDALPEDQLAYKQAVDARNAHLKDVLQPLAAEYVPRKAEIAQLKERQRVEKLSPLEYQMQQAGVDLTAPPKEERVFTGEEEITKPPAPEATYAQQQMALAQQQDMGTFEAKDFADYLMQDPAMAQRLVETRTAIPGVSKRESDAILGGLKLQLQDRVKQERAATQAELQQRQADLKAQQVPEEADPLAMWKASVEETEEQATEELLRPNFETLRPTGPATVTVAPGVKPIQNPTTLLKRIDDLIAARDQAAADANSAFASGNKELGIRKSQEREAAQTALNNLEQMEGAPRALMSLRKAQDTALMNAAQLIDDLKVGRTLGGPEAATASSTPQTLINQINKQRDAFITSAVQEAAATRRLFAKALTQKEATQAANQIREVFNEWVTRSMAQPRAAVEQERVVAPAQMRGTEVVRGAETERFDPRPLEERRFGAYKAATQVLQEQLRQISSRLSEVPKEGRRVEPTLKMQFPETEAAKVAEAKGETAQTLEGQLRRRRDYAQGLIDQAFQTRKVPGIAETLLTRAQDFLPSAPNTLLDAVENVADRIVRGQTLERSDLIALRDEVRAASARPGEAEVAGERVGQRELFPAEERRALAPKEERGALGLIREKPEAFQAVRAKESAKAQRVAAATQRSEQLTQDIRTELDRIDKERQAALEQRVEERRDSLQSAWQSAVKKAKNLVLSARKAAQKPQIDALKKEIDAIRKGGIEGLNKETIDRLLAARAELDKLSGEFDTVVEAAEFLPIAQANKWVAYERGALDQAEKALAETRTPQTVSAVQQQKAALQRAEQARVQSLKGEEKAAEAARMRAAQTGLGLPGQRRVEGRVERIEPEQTAAQRAAEAQEARAQAREESAQRAAERDAERTELEQRVLDLGTQVAEREAAQKRARTPESKAKIQTEIDALTKEVTLAQGQLDALGEAKPRKKGPATVPTGAALAKQKPLRTGYRKALEAASEGMRRERERDVEIPGVFEFGPQEKLFSRGATPNPSTTASARTELSKAFTDLGRVQIFDTVDALIAANPQYEGKLPSDARGFVDTAGNKAFLIAENIDQGQALSVLLHEVGAHIGLKNMLGDAQYNALVNAVKSWEKRTNNSTEAKVAKAARARVEAAETTAGQVNDELLAYAIEEAVNAGVKPTETKGVLGQWLSRVAALFGKALEKFGLPPKTLDAQGIVDMAFGAAKLEMRGQATPEAGGRGDLRFSYAGEKSGVAPDALRKAKDLQIKGAEMEKIWNETGWFQGPDKKWRYEIDDSKAKFNITDLTNKYAPGIGDKHRTTIGALMDHPELYALYPDIKNIQVVLYNDPNSNTLGSFDRTKKEIELNVGTSYDPEKVLLHELQHYIQGEEGLTRGGSSTGKYLEGYTKSILNAVRESYVREAEENAGEKYYADKVKAIDAGIAAAQAVKSKRAAELIAARAEWQKTSRAIEAELETLKNEYKSRQDAAAKARDAYYDASDAYLALLQSPDKSGAERFEKVAAAKAKSDQALDALNKAEAAEVPYADYSKRSSELRDQKRKAHTDWLKVRYAGKVDIETTVNNAIQSAMPKGSFFGKFARLTISEQAYQNLLGEVEARDVEERLKLSEKDRRDTRPYSSQPQRREEILFSRNLPTAARVADQLVGQQKGWLQKLRENYLGIGGRTQFVDMRFPLEEALKKGGVEDLDAMQAMYYVRMYDQKMHFTSEAITEGVPEVVEKTRKDGRTERIIEAKAGANLTQAYKILTSKEVIKEAGSADAANKLVTLYMAAIRGANKGYDKLNFGRAWATQEIKRLDSQINAKDTTPEERTNLQKRRKALDDRLDTMPTPEDIKASRAEIEANPVLREAFDKVREVYNEYNRNLLQLAVQTGAISKDHARTLLAQNDYIPYYRMRGGVAEMVIGGETPIRIGNIKDNQELQELVGGDEPILDFITSSMQNTSMLVDMSLRNIAMKNAMFELRDVGLATVAKEPKGGAPKGSVTFKKDGEDYYAVVNTDVLGISSDLLVKGLAGIPTMFPMWVRAMGVPARWLRRAIVAAPPYWAKQVFRDSLGAAMSSGADIVPILGALRQIGKDNVLERRGITGGQVFTGLPEDKKRMLAAMQSGKISLPRGMAWLEATSAKADALTRKNQYESYLAQGLSEMEATYMALESMNFSKRGLSPSVHYANILIPFFNSQIQGLDALYKAFRGKMPMNERLEIRKKLWTRGMFMFTLSMAYAWAMQDDEAYKNAKPDEKYGNWFVPLKHFGIDETLRLPIPFELGYIFKGIPEAIVNSVMREEGAKEARDAFTHIAQQTVPGGSSLGIPAAAKTGLEATLGVSLYTMRPIESAQEQMLEPGYRTRENTTELARQIGEMTNFSPIKLEFLVRGYTGSMGMAALAALSAPLGGTGPEPATKRLTDMPVVGTLFQPKDASGIIDATYERLNKVNQLVKTHEKLLQEGRVADAEKYFAEHQDDMALGSLAGSFKQFMGEITQMERQVRASPTMTPEKKREYLDALRQTKIKVAESVRDSVRAAADRKKLQASPA